MTFHLQVLSPVKKIFDGEVERISLPSPTGEMEVLPRHMSIVTPLTFGEVSIKRNGGLVDVYTIGKGLFFISKNEASLLIEDVKSSDEISESAVLEARKRAEEILAKGLTKEEKLQGAYLLRRSLIDLKLIKKRQRKFA